MLSTNSTSSIQKRRQHHRRQQSLEVPILATPLPANPRRPKPATQGHRRGLSLDQSLSALDSPTGFRPLLPQDRDQEQFQGPSPVRIHLDHTNIAIPPDQQQHFVQETQQHRPAQPGYQAQDFQSHLQQQLNGSVNTANNIIAPTPTHPNHEQALQDLQQHLEWYQQNFGHSPSPNPIMQANTAFNANQQMVSDVNMNAIDAHVPPQQFIVAMPQTPVSHGHSRTVPNTPQHHVRTWASPPATDMKHVRSQSFQLDVAPMPLAFDGGHVMSTNSPYSQVHDSFTHDSFTTGGDHIYASSAYSSSNVDPSSPGRQYNGGPMPTLFEEEAHCLGSHPHSHGMDADSLLLHAAAGASDDFNSPNFIVGGGMPGMSPRSAMIHNIGDEVNATIVDTGIPPEEVDMHISAQDPVNKWWRCLYEEDGKTCGKWFKRKENARSHVQNHMGDRQFQCNDCGKTFVRQHDMKRHAAIHKDDRPHICPCGSKFARHDALTRHRQRGMCSGALPGYEKSEEEKPKRGRPKKDRPDQKTRTSKANKARQMDRENDAAVILTSDFNYGSPSSGMSDHSLPMTPPDTSDFDADAFINMANADIDWNPSTSSWRDTPPTSPVSTGPIKTISPHLLTGGTISSQPGAPYNMSTLNTAVTPDPSAFGSSPYTAEHGMSEMRQASWSSVLAFHDPLPIEKEPQQIDFALRPMLDEWLAAN